MVKGYSSSFTLTFLRSGNILKMIFQNNKTSPQTHTIVGTPHDVKTLQMCLYCLKSVKKTHLLRLIHEAGCSNGILYYLFWCWALEIHYRALRPLLPSCEWRFFKCQHSPPMLETMDHGTAFKEGMPACVHSDYLKAMKLTLAHSEFSTYTQMNTLFLERNKTSLLFTMALTSMPILKIRLLLKSFQRKPKFCEVSSSKWFRTRKAPLLRACHLAAIKECYGLVECPVLAT